MNTKLPYALILKTDNRSQAGHDYVVVYVGPNINNVRDFRDSYLEWITLPEHHVVQLISDTVVPGVLLCTDEFN